MDYFELIKQHPNLADNNGALIKIIKETDAIEGWQAERRARLNEKDLPASFADIGVVFEDPYFIILRDLVQFSDGGMNGYCRLLGQANLRGGQGVVVLPEYQGKIMLLHQYRHPTRQWHYEVPRGYGEANTSVAENARKEIEEETGGQIAELVALGAFYNNTGFEANPVSLFYARLASVGAPAENEGIESYVWLDVAEFEQWIADEKITDGFTIAAYTKAKLKGLF